MANQGGLAGTNVATDDGETGLVHQAVLQHRKRHAMLVAHVQKARVGQ